MNKCKYCNPNMSYGNDYVYIDEDVKIFIAKGIMKILKAGDKIATNIKIKNCPICGRKIKKREVE